MKFVAFKRIVMYYRNIMNKPEVTISFNAPIEIKSRLQKMAEKNGLSVSVLMRMSAMQILNNGISIEPNFEPSDELKHTIATAERDYKAGKLTTVDSEAALLDHLKDLKR